MDDVTMSTLAGGSGWPVSGVAEATPGVGVVKAADGDAEGGSFGVSRPLLIRSVMSPPSDAGAKAGAEVVPGADPVWPDAA